MEDASMRTAISKRRQLATALALGLIVLLGAFLRFYQLGAHSIGNAYYATTVKSMLSSWHNFFFAAFEPGGSVSVDKPPLGFWIQAASAYVLGVNGFALAFPQALAGTLSIALVYHLVQRQFGRWPGLAAALALAVTPVAVATERNNTIDGLLVFTLLLAAWAFIVAAERGRLRHLLLGAALVGLGFNIKMLQATMPVPAFYALYLLAARAPWWRRVLHLGAATVVMLAVSFAWVAAVDLTPADQRPYVGSSQDNTVLELIVGHNGLARLGLMARGPRTGTVGQNQTGPLNATPPQGHGQAQQPPSEALAACEGLSVGEACTVEPRSGTRIQGTCREVLAGRSVCVPRVRDGGHQPAAPSRPSAQRPQTGPAGQGGSAAGGPRDQGTRPGAGRSGETGTAGLLRLFEEPLATEASWLLPLALLGVPLALVTLGWAWPLTGKHAGVLLWTGWLLPEAAYFTFTTGLFHRYYLIMLGPPLAALVGITLWALIRLWRRNRLWGWTVLLVLSGFSVGFEVLTSCSDPVTFGAVAACVILSWLAGMVFLLREGSRGLRWAGIALVSLALLVAPLTWSALTTFNTNPDVALPTAGADGTSATTFMTPNQELLGPDGEAILAYVAANTEPDSTLLATNTARDAAPFILATGHPVFTFGGFTGGDAVVDVEGFIEMVEGGELRYVLGLPQQKPAISQWVRTNCTPVEVPGASRSGGHRGGAGGGAVLYDCGGG
jgi:4-amino-4-deoxy-L-arabinose transferase-like glycosyltransferase